MHVTGTFNKLAQDTIRFINILECVFGENFFPYVFGPFKMPWKWRLTGDFGHFAFENLVENPPRIAGVSLALCFEFFQRPKSHQGSEADLGIVIRRYRM